MLDYFEDTNWIIVILFWIPISIGIWKFWTKSVLMGTVGMRIFAIIMMFLLITVIVTVMGDN